MKKNLKPLLKFLAVYGPQLWLIFFVANIAVITIVRTMAQTANCMNQDQINSDSRCLYIYNGQIYNIGSRSNPHHGHSCGSDVTSILPSSHRNSINSYLLPNFVAAVCSTNPQPTTTPTTAPTQAPTNQPTRPPTTAPTQKPTNAPTSAPTQPPAQSSVTPTPAPTATNVAQNTNPQKTNTPLATPVPTQNTNVALKNSATTNSPTPTDLNLGKFTSRLPGLTGQPVETITPTPIATNTVTSTESSSQARFDFLYWTTITSYLSFVILLITGGFMLVQKIKIKIKEKENEIQSNIT